jgi:hypothetical protein
VFFLLSVVLELHRRHTPASFLRSAVRGVSQVTRRWRSVISCRRLLWWWWCLSRSVTSFELSSFVAAAFLTAFLPLRRRCCWSCVGLLGLVFSCWWSDLVVGGFGGVGEFCFWCWWWWWWLWCWVIGACCSGDGLGGGLLLW